MLLRHMSRHTGPGAASADVRLAFAGHDAASGAVCCQVTMQSARARVRTLMRLTVAGAAWLVARRKAAGDLEMQLHEVESRSRLEMAKMRMAAVGEAETVAAKVEAMDGQVARLQSVEAALQRGVLGLLESRRHLEGQMEHRSAPRQDLQRAGEEIARLQAAIDGLGERLRAKEDETVKLRETMQVDGAAA